MFVARTSKAPWMPERGVEPVLARWLKSKYVKPCLMADATIASAEGAYAPIPEALAPELSRALGERGIDRLYSHQAQAFKTLVTPPQAAGGVSPPQAAGGVGPPQAAGGSSRRGFVVATPTASGKSLCFHLPVLQAMLEDPDARAIYIFPTKALARDQEASLRELVARAATRKSAIVYDGDTPADARRAARERGGIIITNPDMLHTGILPHHTTWARTMQHLEYVVVDEMHMYKGVFGSHVANVLRRLLRVAHFHGSHPRLIGATATIGNPLAHAARLFGVHERELALISDNGAPRGERRFFLFNPPVVNAELGVRASYVKQAVMLAADLVRARVPTLVFGHSRNNVEVMLRYLRDKVEGEIDPQKIQGYRGGYLPGTRRAIEEKLRAGEILAVVATNALELGIDIGELDAVICAGYPGSVAGTWQRFGRAGRRGSLSICVLVTSSAPVDQYLAREPDFLLGAAMEEARIDPSNVEILIQHLKCAAFELPFRRGESFGGLSAEETADALGFLAHHKVLHEAGGTFHWAADAYPANNVSLRSVGWDNVVIIDVEKDESFAELDWRGAHTMLHEQAIYQHDGECWQVERLDYENHKAFVRKVEPDYFTDAMTYTQVSVLEDTATGSLGGTWSSGWGEVAVVEKVVGYKKIKFFTHENAGYGDVRLPEMQMHTMAFWLTVPEAECRAIAAGKAAAVDGLRGVGKALETVATLALMCDPRDIGATMGDVAAEGEVPGKSRGGVHAGYSPTLFLYEHTPGGIGLSERIFEQREVLLGRARALIATCPCVGGCPSCVGPADPNVSYTRKSVALELLGRRVSGTEVSLDVGASSENRAPSHA
jgi:DEAD/DEAH box helicase domain-containing protein